MLKNLSDYLSLITLLFFVYSSLRLFVWAFSSEEVNEELHSRFELLNDYHNNEEE